MKLLLINILSFISLNLSGQDLFDSVQFNGRVKYSIEISERTRSRDTTALFYDTVYLAENGNVTERNWRETRTEILGQYHFYYSDSNKTIRFSKDIRTLPKTNLRPSIDTNYSWINKFDAKGRLIEEVDLNHPNHEYFRKISDKKTIIKTYHNKHLVEKRKIKRIKNIVRTTTRNKSVSNKLLWKRKNVKMERYDNSNNLIEIKYRYFKIRKNLFLQTYYPQIPRYQVIMKYDSFQNMTMKKEYRYPKILTDSITYKYIYESQNNWVQKNMNATSNIQCGEYNFMDNSDDNSTDCKNPGCSITRQQIISKRTIIYYE